MSNATPLCSALTNFVLNSDSYNYSHPWQYPADTVGLSHYGGPRKGAWGMNQYLPAGMQAFIQEYMTRPITTREVVEARNLVMAHSGYFDFDGWLRVVNKHGGYLPVRIEAIPEGRPTSIGAPAFQIFSTDRELPNAGAWLETSILRGNWYMSTAASKTYRMKLKLIEGMRKTCNDLSGLPFKVVDFGARGASSLESAALGGLGVLQNFAGTDNLSSIIGASRWYGMNTVDKLRGFSIPAASHGTISSWGVDGETDAYSNMLKQFGYKPGAKVAVVSDIRHLWEAIEYIWGGTLKADVQRLQEFGACLIIRPDSGIPIETVRRALQMVSERFGYTENSVGCKQFPDYVRLIQGDGIDVESLDEIVDDIVDQKWSLDNINFGSGGALLQGFTRDTMSWAMKQNARLDSAGVWHDNSKCPVDDPGKASFAGRLAVVNEGGRDVSIRLEDLGDRENILTPLWDTGMFLRPTWDTLDDTRARNGLWLP